MPVLTPQKLEAVRADAFADDVPITDEMLNWAWTADEAAAYFESGGAAVPASVAAGWSNGVALATDESISDPSRKLDDALAAVAEEAEGAASTSSREEAGDTAYWQPPRPQGSRLMFRVCFVLMIVMPIAVLAVALRAVLFGSTSVDTGTAKWSPPSDPMIPVVVSIAVLPALGLLILLARRTLPTVRGDGDFWGHGQQARAAAIERADPEEARL